MKTAELSPKGVMPDRADLSDQVTVFIITVGDRENYADCIKHLQDQDCRFRYEIIDHVAPMSAAFQQMIDRCETPYFVQVDEDMMLYPYAVRILHDTASRSDPNVAIVCYSLWDQHMQKAILGVKIYKTAILKQFPYRLDVPHCDMDQVTRMKEDGFAVLQFWHGYDKGPQCIGQHGCHYTPESAFEAYYNRAMKSRMFPEWMSWCRKLLAEFWERVKANPTDLDLYAMLGFAAGMTGDLSAFDHEKDYRTPTSDFRRLRADMETSPPSQLSLHVTSRCNLKCRWCPRQSGKIPALPDMSAEMLQKALEACPSVSSICIAGFGEPLLCSNLEYIAAEAVKRKLPVWLITNGILLEDFAPILKAWGVERVSVSLNATTTEEYQAVTGAKSAATWNRVLTGIQAGVHFMPGKIDVSFVCNQQNIGRMGAFIDLAAELGVANIDFVNQLPNEGDTCSREDFWRQVLLDDPGTAAKLKSLRSHRHARIVRTWPTPISREHCPRRCQSPYVSISLDAAGQVSGCRRVTPPSKESGSIWAPVPPWRLPQWYLLRAGLEGDRPLPDTCKMCFANWSA